MHNPRRGWWTTDGPIPMSILHQQYNLIRERRETLFGYCESLTPAHFNQNIGNFGGRSIGYILVHVAETYFSWLGVFTGLAGAEPLRGRSFSNMKEVRHLYGEVNDLAATFLHRYQPGFDEPVTDKFPDRTPPLVFTPLQLFTHVITHEYHHKGQVLSMGRQLGYTPIDTDLIRFA